MNHPNYPNKGRNCELRLRELPVNEFINTVLLVELEFVKMPKVVEYIDSVIQL